MSRYLLRPLGLEIEYTNIKGRSDHIYLTFNQPPERQKLYHKIILARQSLNQTNSELDVDETQSGETLNHPLKSKIGNNDRLDLFLIC